MWIGVTERFSRFNSAITPTSDQIQEGITSAQGIVGSLNRNYRGQSAVDGSAFFAGSWGKQTNRYPFNDADVFYVLPVEVYWRIDQLQGNKQSQLLQEVKRVLSNTYGQTDMRGDGQVVQVRFNHLLVEVVPAFQTNNGCYLICDTNNGGRWKQADPVAEIDSVQRADDLSSKNARNLIRMLKTWKEECSVPLESYRLETIICQFLNSYEWRNKPFYWYDYILRDAFGFIKTLGNSRLLVPDGSSVHLGNEWVSRAETAYQRALNACAHEYNDSVQAAGQEWQKIFGQKIPIYV